MTVNGELRSTQWFGATGRTGMAHRSWMRSQGFTPEVFDGRPVIGIATTWSELAPCNVHLHRVAESVKRGVWQAGGFPLEFPAMALGETLLRPTAMLYRNLLAMEAEELMRANPLDGVVLLSGCDKTTPGLLMAASSVDLPAVMVTGGPMLNGKYQGTDVGSGTAVWRFEEDLVAGRMTQEDCAFAEGCMARSNGHCMTMGTASTMASMAEALGMQLPYSATWPAVDARRYETAQQAGQVIVGLVSQDLRPSAIMTRAAFENAIRVNAAIGGSTNAVIHLLAIAGRLGVPLSLDDFDVLARDVPTLVNLQPNGQYLMEDFCYAGGLPAVIRELAEAGLLNSGAMTVTGAGIGTNVADAPCWNREVIKTMADPFQPAGTGTAVLRGNLAPGGAVIKQSASSPHLLKHRGRALVFDSPADYYAVSNDPELDVDEDTVLVIRYCGPQGYPGMPEVSNVTLPRKLLLRGVRDLVRICDGRMSGTAYGTVVLHVAPEAAAGGPLALARNGDWIALDVPARTLTLEVSDEELDLRRAQWQPPAPHASRGWTRLYCEHVLQADSGADLDFLVGASGHEVPRESHLPRNPGSPSAVLESVKAFPALAATLAVATALLTACGAAPGRAAASSAGASAAQTSAAPGPPAQAARVFGRVFRNLGVTVTGGRLYVTWQANPLTAAVPRFELARVDQVTGAIKAAHLLVPGQVGTPLAAGGWLWVPVVTSAGWSLLRLDPVGLAGAGELSAGGGSGEGAGRSSHLAVAGGALWVAAGDRLLRVSLTTGQVIAAISLPGAYSSDVAANQGGTILVASEATGGGLGSVQRRDPVTGTLIASRQMLGVAAPGIGGVIGSGVWVAEATGMMGYIERFRTATMAPDPATEVGGTNGIDVTVTGGLAWITEEVNPSHDYCANPVTGRVLARIRLPDPGQDVVLTTSDRYVYYESPAGNGFYLRRLPVPGVCRG
jgi:dihydroxy-acid dehydratase